MQVEGSSAIVFGGASGLGEASARRLHEHGARVTIADLNEDKGGALADELGDEASFVKTDVTDADEVEAAVAAAAEAEGVNTASAAAYDGQIGQLAYSASKGGIVGMTLPAARDLSSSGIRVVTIAPGLFNTPLFALLPQEAREALGATVPFPNRLGEPPEFAQLVQSVVENPMLNGEVIRLDGALRMAPR